jgi:hypothetical protein
MDPGINLCHAQLFREGAVGAAWPRVQPHFDLLPPKRLNSAAGERP